MPQVILHRGPNGKPEGITPAMDRAYQRFRARAAALEPRDSLVFSWREPRSGPYHRRHFVMLDALFQAQERFEDDEKFRKWLEVGAGYCDLLPGPTGELVAVPKSIAYEKLDQLEFEPIHAAVFAFARSERCTAFLWPHLTAEQRFMMVETTLAEFEL